MNRKFDHKFYLSFYPDLKKNGIITPIQARRHWIKHGRLEGRLGSKDDPKYLENCNTLKENNKELEEKYKNKTVDPNSPIINIITRTHNREASFIKCINSLKKQTNTNYIHWVSIQDKKDKSYVERAGIPLSQIVPVKKESISSHYYNLFINKLLNKVTEGWIMFLDDDDHLASPYSLQYLSEMMQNRDQLLYWKAWFPDKIIPKQENPFLIKEGDITSCCFAFHSKYKELAYWNSQRAGDYRCFRNLIQRLEPVNLNYILTQADQIGGGINRIGILKSLYYYFKFNGKTIINRFRDYTELIPCSFDNKLYCSYPDLKQSGISGRRKAWIHWKYNGSNENRISQEFSFESIPLIKTKNNRKTKRIVYLIDKALDSTSDGYTVKSHQTLLYLKKLTAYDIIPIIKPSQNISEERYIIDDIEYLKLSNPNLFKPYTHEYLSNYYLQFTQLCIKKEVGIIHACSNFVNGMIASLTAESLEVPFIYEIRGLWEISTVANHPEFENTRLYKISEFYETKSCNKASLNIVINSGIKKELIKRGINNDSIEVIPFSVFDPDFAVNNQKAILPFDRSSDDLVIGHFGTLNAYEGLDDLVSVLARLKQENITNFRLLILGKGPQNELLRKKVNKLGLNQYIAILEPVPYEKIMGYYNVVDIVCIPRKNTKVTQIVLPMKLIEAVSIQKPVLVSSVDALSNVIKHECNGFVFEKGNIDDLYLKLKYLINNKKNALNKLKFKRDEEDYISFIKKIYCKNQNRYSQ